MYVETLTLAIGLHTNDERPIARSRPPVDKLTASEVVFRSFDISDATLSRDVDEKVAPSVTQLRTKTMKHLRQKGMGLSMPDAAVWVFSNVLGSISVLRRGVDGALDSCDLSSSTFGYSSSSKVEFIVKVGDCTRPILAGCVVLDI